MALFTISDLHLSLSSGKPMDVFSGWENYTEKLEQNWNRIVTERDIVVIPGDISWAMQLEDSRRDFEFIDRLKGSKIILKGNHDYWFSTHNKINAFFKNNAFNSIRILHNSYYGYEEFGICGTKGYDITKKPQSDHEKKIENRECMRLLKSLSEASAAGYKRLAVFLHYPPLINYGRYNSNPITEILEQYNVEFCCYGHLHNLKKDVSVNEIRGNTKYKLVSCDYLDFTPYKLF